MKPFYYTSRIMSHEAPKYQNLGRSMAKKSKRIGLSELKLTVMRVVWTRGETMIAEVVSDLERKRALAHTMVATLLLRLENRGRLADKLRNAFHVLVGGSWFSRSLSLCKIHPCTRGALARCDCCWIGNNDHVPMRI
jgi:hypothetical protein